MALNTLSKTRFKLAVECPAKVFYSLDKRYVDQRIDDELLEALAKGGHQVGALAKLKHLASDPAAVEITTTDQAEQIRQTAELLKRDQVTIFEATVVHENLLVRVDVLCKHGNQIDLIEVKASAWNPDKDSLVGKTSRSLPINPDWEEYVYDVAFQQYVLSRAYPLFTVHPFLLLLDKSKRNSFPQLGAKFPIVGEGRGMRVEPANDFDIEHLKEPLLIRIDASEAVRLAQKVVRKKRGRPDLEFEPLIREASDAVAAGKKIDARPSNECKSCEFYCEPKLRTEETRSGWAECMEKYFSQQVSNARSESIFGFYGQANVRRHIDEKHLWMRELTKADLEIKTQSGQISSTERHELQWREISKGDREPFLRKSDIAATLRAMVYPLHFIDFETAAPALPFHVGNRPYQQILFQFSHHVVERDGSVRHATEFLQTTGEESPSIEAVRKLKLAVGNDKGTVLHWYTHERTILKAVFEEIQEKKPADSTELIEFLESLGLENDSNLRMFDLGRLAARNVFLADTGGSSSMKKFLPAVIKYSSAVHERYSQPIYGAAQYKSFNFQSKQWIVEKDGKTLDPYRLLDPLFQEHAWTEVLDQVNTSEGDVVANGAAAMIAYSRLQDSNMSASDRERLEQQLKCYCELDTLAMVMVYEALRDWTKL